MMLRTNLPTNQQVEERWLQWRNGLNRQPERRVVLGLGNLPLGDEGLGVQALRYLEWRFEGRSEIEWVDGGVLGMKLLPLIESCSHLLVVDAVDAGRPPGTLTELGRREILGRDIMRLSEHQVTFQDVLGLAMLLGRAPANFRLIGLQPESMEPGTALSDPVIAGLPALAERVREVIGAWGLLT
ncbi:MAG: HyaD/HybD family hydrogenase maturation endopeptidase [Chloroflexota bacterium]|nr:MAG: HyaD/HybD family hydrogenase maturation endopeptidase [Chloroflexota bacterium]